MPGILLHQLARTYLVRLGGAGAVLPLRLVVGLRSCTKLALLTGPGPLLNVLSFVTWATSVTQRWVRDRPQVTYNLYSLQKKKCFCEFIHLELLMTNHLSLLRMCEYSIVSVWINEYSIWLAAVSAILVLWIFELIEQFADYDNLPLPTRIIQQVLLFSESDIFLTQIIHWLITVQLP